MAPTGEPISTNPNRKPLDPLALRSAALSVTALLGLLAGHYLYLA